MYGEDKSKFNCSTDLFSGTSYSKTTTEVLYNLVGSVDGN